MIKNASLYRIQLARPIQGDDLQASAFVPCGPTQCLSTGWVPPRGQEHGALVEHVAGHVILRLAVETKSVPSQTLNEAVDAKAKAIEDATGRKPGKKERRELRDEVLLELLPHAFPRRVTVQGWIDPEAGMLVIDTASQARADDFISALSRTLPDTRFSLLMTKTNPQAAMTQWLLANDPDEWPQNLSVERECMLKSTGEEAATIKFDRHHLVNEDVRKLVTQGKLPVRLALSWDGRVSFVLNDALKLSKIKLLDGVMDASGTDANEDRFDADVALTTGLLSGVIQDIIEALGGEMEVAAQDGATGGPVGDEPDPLFPDALVLVVEHQKASISLVQRHLQIGYNRAARLIEEMERRGIVSPMKSNGTRVVIGGAA